MVKSARGILHEGVHSFTRSSLLVRCAALHYTPKCNFMYAPKSNVTFPCIDFYGAHKFSSDFLYRIATETG
jgi:hypothetical protein